MHKRRRPTCSYSGGGDVLPVAVLDVLISEDKIHGNAPLTGDSGGVVGAAASSSLSVGHEAERWVLLAQ